MAPPRRPGRPTHVVLTGGPCGGKTTALSMLPDALDAAGFDTVCVPEAARALADAGHPPAAYAAAGRIVEYQRMVLDAYESLAGDAAGRAASCRRPVIVVHDRGVLDNAAYVGRDVLAGLLAERGSTVAAAAAAYDAVVHVTSAAVDAPGRYRVDGTRHETPEAAAALDAALLAAWSGHPGHWVVRGDDTPGGDGFGRKLRLVAAAVLRAAAGGDEIERKFVLLGDPKSRLDALAASGEARVADIAQCYLHAGESERRIRRERSADGGETYTYCEKDGGPGPVRAERESPATEGDYRRAVAAGAPVVEKRRWTFAAERHRVEVDRLLWPREGWLAEVELLDQSQGVSLPAFLRPSLEVTGDPAWAMAAVARPRPAAPLA